MHPFLELPILSMHLPQLAISIFMYFMCRELHWIIPCAFLCWVDFFLMIWLNILYYQPARLNTQQKYKIRIHKYMYMGSMTLTMAIAQVMLLPERTFPNVASIVLFYAMFLPQFRGFLNE